MGHGEHFASPGHVTVLDQIAEFHNAFASRTLFYQIDRWLWRLSLRLILRINLLGRRTKLHAVLPPGAVHVTNNTAVAYLLVALYDKDDVDFRAGGETVGRSGDLGTAVGEIANDPLDDASIRQQSEDADAGA